MGGNQNPGPAGVEPRKATGAEAGTNDATFSRWPAEIERPHLARLVRRVADRNRLHRRLEQLHEPVVAGALHEEAGAGAAVLAGVVEHRRGGRARGPLEIAVGEDHVGRLASELEGHPFHLLGATRHDLAADLGRAGEADLADGGVLDEAATDLGARAGDDLQDPLGDPRLHGELGQAEDRERRELGGLHDDRVARRQRRGEAPAGDEHREVPRHDHPDDAEGLAEGHVDPAGHRDLPAEVALGRRREYSTTSRTVPASQRALVTV